MISCAKHENYNSELQVHPVISNLLISKAPLMSKWSAIPEQFPYILLHFDPVCVKLG